MKFKINNKEREIPTKVFATAVLALIAIVIGTSLPQAGSFSWSTVLTVFTFEKILPFIGSWILFLLIIWLSIKTLIDLLIEGAGYKVSFIPGVILTIILTPFIAGFVSRTGNPLLVMWWFAWLFVLAIVVFRGALKKEGIEQHYATWSGLYFMLGLIAAPFLSLLAGFRTGGISSSYLLVSFVAHGSIALAIYFAGEYRTSMKEEKRETRELEKEERAFQRSLKIEGLRTSREQNELSGLTPSVSRLTQFATSQPGNLNVMYPFLAEIASTLPKSKSIMSKPARFSADEEIKKVEDRISAIKEGIRKLRDDFASTKSGRESEYLLKVAREIQDPEKWLAYVGKNFEKCEFADKLEEWKNPNYQNLQTEFREASKNGNREKVRSLMIKRIRELGRERKEAISSGTKRFRDEENIMVELSSSYRKRSEENTKIISAINAYNNDAESYNNLLDRINSALKRVVETTDENERRSLIQTVISPSFSRTIEVLKKIKNDENVLSILYGEDSALLKEVEKSERGIRRIEILGEILQEKFGFGEEMTEERA